MIARITASSVTPPRIARLRERLLAITAEGVMSHPSRAGTPTIAQHGESNCRSCDKHRNERDVEHGQRRAKILHILAQIGLNLAQALAGLEQVLAQLIDLLLLLRREHRSPGRCVVTAALALQRAQARLGLGDA